MIVTRISWIVSTVLLALTILPSSALSAPVALWTSDPVAPGQTVLVYGDGFAGCRSVNWERLPDSSDGHILSGYTEPLQVRPKSVKFALPASAPAGIFRASIGSQSGSVTVTIILWAQGDSGTNGTAGGFVRIVGKCLRQPGRHASIRITGMGDSRLLTPNRSELFTMQASLPSSLRPGIYQIFASSGAGGDAGWSEPLRFVVADPVKASPVQIDAPEPDQSPTLNSETLQGLLDKAGIQGGTVRLPPGRWPLDSALTIPRNVTLAGAGMNRTALCWTDFETPPPALIIGHDHFGVRDLAMYALNYANGVIADQTTPTAGSIRIDRVRMRLDPYRGHLTTDQVNKRLVQAMHNSSGGGDSLRLGGENIEVADCDIYGGGRCLYLSRASGANIHDNTFYNGRWGWYCFSGNNGVIFENNSITGADLMSTGGGLNCLDGSTCSQNVYYAGNTLKNMFGWDREAMTTDAGGAAYYGLVESAKGTTLTLPVDVKWSRNWAGAAVFVLGGAGEGQYRRIVSTDGRQVSLDKPWKIMPDSTSIITITMLQRNYIFVNNSFTDAGVAIQMYGAAIGNIAYGNTTARTDGYHNFGMNYDGVQPSWYIQWLNNRITDGTVYGGGHDQTVSVGEAHLAVQAMPTRMTPLAPVTLCGIVRGNVLEDSAHLEVGTGNDAPISMTEEVIVEQNTVRNSDVGLIIGRGCDGILTRNNTFVNCRHVQQDEAISDAKAVARRKILYAKPGPLLDLTFDKPEGLKFHDLTGNGFNATAIGKLATEPGPHGGSLVLDGNSYLRVEHPELIQMSSYTISLWIQPDKISGRWGILAKRYTNTTAPFVLTVFFGQVVIEASDTTGQWSLITRTPAVLKQGAWTHVAAVMDAGHGMTIYIDGKPAAHLDSTQTPDQNGEPLCIGRDSWGGATAGKAPAGVDAPALFQGKMADIRVWARALQANEITELAR